MCKLTHPISLCGDDPISANPYWILDLNLNQLFARTIPKCRVHVIHHDDDDHVSWTYFFVLFSGMRMGIILVPSECIYALRCWFDGADDGTARVFYPIIGHTKPVHAHTSNLFWWILFFLLSFLFSSNVTSSRIVVLYRYGEIYVYRVIRIAISYTYTLILCIIQSDNQPRYLWLSFLRFVYVYLRTAISE